MKQLVVLEGDHDRSPQKLVLLQWLLHGCMIRYMQTVSPTSLC